MEYFVYPTTFLSKELEQARVVMTFLDGHYSNILKCRAGKIATNKFTYYEQPHPRGDWEIVFLFAEPQDAVRFKLSCP